MVAGIALVIYVVVGLVILGGFLVSRASVSLPVPLSVTWVLQVVLVAAFWPLVLMFLIFFVATMLLIDRGGLLR